MIDWKARIAAILDFIKAFMPDVILSQNTAPSVAPTQQPPMPQTTPTEPHSTPQSLLDIFLDEIKAMEGWWPGSTSYTHSNPGNLRCTPGNEANWNALAHASIGGFCVFKDDATGMQGLRNVTVAVCEGKSATYNAAAQKLGLHNGAYLSLTQYFTIRDPASDGNEPLALAQRFATKLGVDILTFKMRDLLS